MIKIAFPKAFFPFTKILAEGSYRSRYSVILFSCAVPFVFLLCHSWQLWMTRRELEGQFLHWIVYSEGQKIRKADLESMYNTEIIVWTVKYFPNLHSKVRNHSPWLHWYWTVLEYILIKPLNILVIPCTIYKSCFLKWQINICGQSL